MKIKKLIVLKEVANDLKSGKLFYEAKETGIGDYFWDSLFSDLTSLALYAGIHSKVFGLYRMLAKRFPYAIYYQIKNDIVYVVAILPIRRDPKWIKNQLQVRT